MKEGVGGGDTLTQKVRQWIRKVTWRCPKENIEGEGVSERGTNSDIIESELDNYFRGLIIELREKIVSESTI